MIGPSEPLVRPRGGILTYRDIEAEVRVANARIDDLRGHFNDLLDKVCLAVLAVDMLREEVLEDFLCSGAMMRDLSVTIGPGNGDWRVT